MPPDPCSTRTVPHLRVYDQCGACNRPAKRSDTLVAIQFRLFQTFLGAIYKVPSFRKDELVKRKKAAVFCKDADCDTCSKIPIGSASYHADCFNLFGKYCHAEDKYARLWFAAKRMSSFKNSVCVQRLYDPAAAQQLNIVFELLGLARLPPELAKMVWEVDPTSSHIVARFCSVLQLAAEMNSAPTVPSICPLSEVRFWSRGQQHVVQKDMGDEAPFVRVTIDSRGVKKLERIDGSMELSLRTEVSVIIPAELFSNMDADFRFGLCQLVPLRYQD
ncbi:hypothetical protein V8C35DRAFT_276416 [Trichoderma chlorosporum]